MNRFTLLFAMFLISTTCRAEVKQVQVDNLPTFGRITISMTSTKPVAVRQRGDRVEVALSPGDSVMTPESVPRNVLSFVAGRGTASMVVVPGARAVSRQDGLTLTIDVLDPTSRTRDTAIGLRSNPGRPLDSIMLETAGGEKAADTFAMEASTAAGVSQKARATSTNSSTAVEPTPTELPKSMSTTASSGPGLPVRRLYKFDAGSEAGVAAFRRGEFGVVVFDETAKLRSSPADEPISGVPVSGILERGTPMTIPLKDEETLSFARIGETIEVVVGPTSGTPSAQFAIPAGVQLEVAKVGRVLAISDPLANQTMIIGTTRQLDGDHAMVATTRSAPGFVLLRTWLGVAVEVSSDLIDLRLSTTNLILTVADKAAQNNVVTGRPENLFGIPTAPVSALMRQLKTQVASAALASPRSRGPNRVAVARTMIGLGLAAESQAVLQLAANEDPAIAHDPVTAALTGIAAVLAGRPFEAAGLDNPALPISGDVLLWRALRDVSAGRPAPALGQSWPLLSAYPAAVTVRIAPTILEAAATGGIDVPITSMQGESLALARAFKLEHDGDANAALDAFQQIIAGHDERASVRAAVASAELRLSAGLASPTETADQLERQSLRWRDNVGELPLRLRVAGLRSSGGKWRQALEGLRDAEAAFPASKPLVEAARAGVMRSLLQADPGTIPPLDLVVVAEELSNVVPKDDEGDRMATLLAEKFVALDLPARAIPVLDRLGESAKSQAERFESELRLAQLEIEAGDPASAENRLTSLDGKVVPVANQEQRLIALAHAQAAQGKNMEAATMLLSLSGEPAGELRADYYAKAGDWQRSLDTLLDIAKRKIPADGNLDEKQQGLLLRQALAAVKAGNSDALQTLRKMANRVDPPYAELFGVLTSNAVTSAEDLPRSARELAMSRSLPNRIASIKPP